MQLKFMNKGKTSLFKTKKKSTERFGLNISQKKKIHKRSVNTKSQK